jgi:hypothetical protein
VGDRIYRHRHGIPPDYDDTALGREPLPGQDRQDWRDTLTTIRQVRAELGLEPQRGEAPEVAALPDRIAEPALHRGVDRTPFDLGYDRYGYRTPVRSGHQPPESMGKNEPSSSTCALCGAMTGSRRGGRRMNTCASGWVSRGRQGVRQHAR